MDTFFRNRLLEKAKLPILPIFNPILPTSLSDCKEEIFEPTVLFDRREEIYAFSVLVECYAHVAKKNNGKIGSKIGKIGNLVALGDGF